MGDDGWDRRLRAAVAAANLTAAHRAIDHLLNSRPERDDALDVVAQLAANGSDTALELLTEIVDSTGLARAGVRRILVTEDEVDEVTQDTLVSMTTSIGSFSPAKGKFTTWLFEIARRRAVDHLRRRKDADTLGDDMGEAARISSLIATRLTVQQKVEQLPSHYRDALVLRDIERLSYAEAADRLGMNLNTFKSHVARGRAVLATMLDPAGA